MSTPFPGMDPYLERPNLWAGVHNRLIVAIADFLSPRLRPRYFVSVQERSHLDRPLDMSFTSIPDVGVVGPYAPRQSRPGAPVAEAVMERVAPLEIQIPLPNRVRETYLEIQEINADPALATNGDGQNVRVITMLEILSPWNKRSGEGRLDYVRKRNEILRSRTSLVEIDLLRSGERLVEGDQIDYDYSLFVSPAADRPRAFFWPFTIRDAIPAFTLPLQPDDDEPEVDLNTILHELYDRAGYDLRIRYGEEPIPPLEDDDAAWVGALLREAGLRDQ